MLVWFLRFGSFGTIDRYKGKEKKKKKEIEKKKKKKKEERDRKMKKHACRSREVSSTFQRSPSKNILGLEPLELNSTDK